MTIKPDSNKNALAYVLDPDGSGKPRFEIRQKIDHGGYVEENTFSFNDKSLFIAKIKEFKVPSGGLIDKRSKKKRKAKKPYNSWEINSYRKVNQITAIQFRKGRNDALVEKFITSNGGEYTKHGTFYRVKPPAKNTEQSEITSDKDYDNLHDKSYVIYQTEGDVYACLKKSFEDSYDFVTRVPEEDSNELKNKKDKVNTIGTSETNEDIETDEETKSSYDASQQCIYEKKSNNKVKAMQLNKQHKNERKVEEFIRINGGSYNVYDDKYRVYFKAGGHASLTNEDYVICKEHGDVYACQKEVFEHTYSIDSGSSKPQSLEDFLDDDNIELF